MFLQVHFCLFIQLLELIYNSLKIEVLILRQNVGFRQFLVLRPFVVVDDIHERFCPYINILILELILCVILGRLFIVKVIFIWVLQCKLLFQGLGFI